MSQRIAKRIHDPKEKGAVRQERTSTKEHLHQREQKEQFTKPNATERGRELAKEKAVRRTVEQNRTVVQQPATDNASTRIFEPPKTAGQTHSQQTVTDKTVPKALDHRATTPKVKTSGQAQATGNHVSPYGHNSCSSVRIGRWRGTFRQRPGFCQENQNEKNLQLQPGS